MAFQGNVALITGAASGMGRLAARRLAAGGARIAALDVNEEGLRQTRGDDERIQSFAVDVTDSRAVIDTVQRIEAELGPIDRVMNAAAIMPTDRILDQAKSQPKVLSQLPPIAPEAVLDAIERDLERHRLMVFPDRNAAIAVWLRRHLPGLLWRNLHRVEGFSRPVPGHEQR